MKHLFFLIIFIIPAVILAGDISVDSPAIEKALDAAKNNKAELEKVITNYEKSTEKLKLQAALFLIANMEEHCYVTYNLIDSSHEVVELNILDFPDYASLTTKVEFIEKKRGELDYEKDEKIYDIETITAVYLINQIELAFKAWQNKPWAKQLPFDAFCRYVLPYRGSNEPLEPWRGYFLEKYENLQALMKDSTDAMEAASLINEDVRSWFGFDERFYFHPTDQGLSEMIENKLGRCEDMTNLSIYAMRANGLAVTSDYTPYWANNGNNHAWNAIVKPDGEVIPFMGAESNPGQYKLQYKYAKVYRKMYNQNPDNLVFKEHKQDKIPRWLSGKSYIDVTADYTDVTDVTIKFEKDVPDSVDIAYICVFNSGYWKPIHWGRIDGKTATFTDMAKDIAYLPALYLNEEIEPYGPPFILAVDGSIINLAPDETNLTSIELNSTTRRKQDKSTEGIMQTYLAEDTEYELFYFSDGWVSLGKKTAGKTPLQFSDVPQNCVLWLVETGSNREERIFTYDNGTQIWW